MPQLCPRLPARGLQIVGGRGQRIGSGVPDIAAAIAIEVHGVALVGGGDELGLAHRAGPGALHALWLHVTLLEDRERGEQLVVGELRAATFVGEGCQRADHAHVAGIGAEVAFHAPDGDQGVALHAVALLDAAQGLGMLGEQALAIAHTLQGSRAIQVFPHRPGELRLALVGTDHRRVGSHPGKGALEGGAVDAGSQRLAAKAVAPLAEALLHHGGGGRGDSGRRGRLHLRCGGRGAWTWVARRRR